LIDEVIDEASTSCYVPR